MNEIRPMQLWETEGGYTAFITHINMSENTAFGISFGRGHSETIRTWDSGSGVVQGDIAGLNGANLTKCIGHIYELLDEDTFNLKNKPSTSKYISWEDFAQIQELINSNIADLNNELVDLRSRVDSQKDFLDEFQENTRQKFTQQDKGHGEEGKFFRGWLREVENKATTMRHDLNNLKKVQVSIRVFLIICALILGVYFIAYDQIITCK